jgi:PAS domain S-box-containing protein
MKRLWLAGFGLCIGLTAVLLILVCGTLKASAIREDAYQWETHTSDVLLAVNLTLSALQDAETGQRGYLLAMRLDYLEPYYAGVKRVGEAIEHLAELTQDDVTQQARIAELRGVAAAKLTELAETVYLAQSGNHAGALALLMTGQGKVMMDEARRVLQTIGAEEDTLLRVHQAAARDAAAHSYLMSSTLAATATMALLTAMVTTVWALLSDGRLRVVRVSVAFERQLRLLIDRAPAAIALFDTNMRYLAANGRYLLDYGLTTVASPEALIGRSHYDVFPGVPERWRDIHRKVLAGEALAEQDDPVTHASGSTDWLNWEMVPWNQPDGTVGGAILFSEVVTARKQASTRQTFLLAAEHELRELTETLDLRLRQETDAREAHETRRVQAEKLTALGQLAGGIVHDFNNILHAVSAGVSLIDKHADEPAKVKRSARMVEAAAERGSSITRRLLAFFRRDEMGVEAIHIPAVLEGLRDVLTHTMGASYAIRIDAGTGLPPVLADRGQLETVLVNLATNARDAMQSGGTITFSVNLQTVPDDRHPAGLASGTYARLTVKDTGTGMDQATLARVTEPFFTTKAQNKGTGLGLPLVRDFAEQSGGALAIVSEPGQGTTVTLWLPVTGVPATAPSEAGYFAPMELNPETFSWC